MKPAKKGERGPLDTSVDDLPDRALLRSYAERRDLAAFDTLVDRHQAALLRLAHALLIDAHAAQDAVQETFMRLCQQASSLVSSTATGDGLGGWLTTVVRNHCIDRLRLGAYQRMQRLHHDMQDGQVLDEAHPVDADGLWGAVGTLPALERAVVVLRYRDRLSYAEIGQQLGKSNTHVGVLLHSALGRLRLQPALRAQSL